MEYTQLHTNGPSISRIGLGTWAIGGGFYGSVDDTDSIAAIRAAVDSGVTLIDTAPSYGDGHAEEVVGRALGGIRDRVVLATKCGVSHGSDGSIRRDLRAETIRREVEESLSRLQTDVIDLYQLHWPDPHTPISDTLGELTRLKDAGKIRFVGVSNFPPRRLEEVAGLTEVISTQPHFSILDRRIEHDVLPFARSHSIGVITYGTLGGGVLTGKFSDSTAPPQLAPDDRRAHFYNYFRDPVWSRIQGIIRTLDMIAHEHGVPASQVAINWARQYGGISAVLVGAKTPYQATQNALAGEWQLRTDEIGMIDRAIAEAFEKR